MAGAPSFVPFLWARIRPARGTKGTEINFYREMEEQNEGWQKHPSQDQSVAANEAAEYGDQAWSVQAWWRLVQARQVTRCKTVRAACVLVLLTLRKFWARARGGAARLYA